MENKATDINGESINIDKIHRTALWPIYVDKETGKIIDTVTNMMRPVDPKMVELCKKLTEGTESDSLKRFMSEMFLTCNSDLIKDYIDFIIIACDTKTHEIIDFVNPPQTVDHNERMGRLIDLTEAAAIGSDKNGNANEFMTIISNVVARYCASDPSNYDSFKQIIEFWKNKIKAVQK